MCDCIFTSKLGVVLPIALAAILTGPIVYAQSQDEQEKPSVLSGPKVEDKADDEAAETMRPRARAQRQVDVPFGQWMRLLRQLELADDQKPKVNAVAEEFETAQREFTEAQGEDGRELFRQVREARESGQGRLPPELRDKLRAIEENRPKPGPYQERIWALLNDKQQADMKSSLDEARARLTERRRARGGDAEDPMSDTSEPRRRRRAAEEQDQPTMQKPTEPTGDQMDQPADKTPDRVQPRRGQRRGFQGKLDPIGQRRLNFLLSKQAAESRLNHPTGEPAPAEREFEFQDDQNEGNEEDKN